MRHWLLLIALGLLALSGTTAAFGADAESPAWTADDEAHAVTTPSGLKYVDTEPGGDTILNPGEVATILYSGRLPDGTLFDSVAGFPRGFQTRIPGPVIAGWNEGLLGMHVGGTRKLLLSANLAFGAAGFGDIVPPNATVVYRISLLGVSHTGTYASTLPWTDAENGAAVQLDRGLKYVDEVVGSGAEVTRGSTITCNYIGWLIDGTKFDSSLDPERTPFVTIIPGQVIEGWNKGLIGMKVGGRRKLYIPGDLAYGATGRPPTIQPYATLIFEVELLDVK